MSIYTSGAQYAAHMPYMAHEYFSKHFIFF